MSREIDEKVVSMQFDNAQFERNVRTSIGTLDKLKQSLNLEGAAKGLDNVNSAAKGFSLAPLTNGIETVKAKFSALEIMAVTTLANITNSAVNAGKRIVNAFTLEPIMTGFQEYETQINSVQTILSNTRSKGTTLDQVNSALDELNHYADRTIYNFTEMTRNIGTFTAAGVDLDTSVSAIKGIANLAAVSGSTSQQASTAMYQLSQALAAGTVKLMDWNSVVNAGMGGQVFQDALKETARVHGIAIDEMIESEGSFRETLQKGWLSSEILTETLAKFTGDLTEEQLKSMGYTDEQAKSIMALGEDANNAATKVKTFTQLMDTLKEAVQSGWTQTWEYIVGDFEDAKKLWTSVSDTLSDMINKSAEARNKVVGEWAENGGRAAAIEAVKNAFEALMNIVKPVKEAFSEIFPPVTSEQLIKVTERVRDLTATFKEWTEKHGPQIKSTFKGIFAVLDIFATAINKVAGGMIKLISNITGLGSGLIGISGSLGNWLSGLRDSIKETNIFGKAVDSLVGFLQKAIDSIKDFFKAIGKKVDSSGLEGFANVLKNIWTFISEIGKSIGGAFGKFFRSGDLQTGLNVLNSGVLASLLIGLKKFVSGGDLDKAGKFLQSLLNPLENFKEKAKPVTGMLRELKGCLQAYQQDLKANVLFKVAGAIAILAAAIFVMSTIDPADLGSALSGMTVLFIELVGAMAALEKVADGYKKANQVIGIMLGMSVSVFILATSLKKLSSLSLGELAKGLAGVLGLMTILVGTMKALSKTRRSFKKGAKQMVIMAAALIILASVCKKLSELSWGELAKGVAGIGGILLIFIGYQALMSKIKPAKMMRSATSLAIIGVAMEIFADVCKKFSTIEWGELAKAGAAISGILAIAAGFTLLSGLSKKMARSSIALIIIGSSMEIFADVCQKFSTIEWGGLVKAGAAIGGILVLAAGFTLLSGLSKKMIASVVSLTIIAAAMEIFADICQKFGGMDWEQLIKAGAAISGILAIAAGFAILSNLSSGILKASAALLVMAAALAILAPVLKAIGAMQVSSIVKSLAAIAGVFALIWVAGIALAPVIPVILSLAGAIALLGVAALAFGAGVTLIGAGMTSLAIGMASGVTAIVGNVLTILEGLGEALVLIGKAVIEAAPIIGLAITSVILAVVDTLVDSIPAIAEGIMKILMGVLEVLVKYAPTIVNYLFDFLIGLIDALGKRIPDLIVAVVNYFGKLFAGVIDALKSIDTGTLVNAILGVGLIAAFIVALNALTALIPGAMVGLLGLSALVVELGLVLAALGAISQIPGLDWLISEGGTFLQTIGTAIGQFIGGIIGGIAKGATSALPSIATDLSTFMVNIAPFLTGAKLIDQTAMEGVKSLIEVMALLTGASFMESIASWLSGGSSFTDFADKLVVFGESMRTYADTISGMDVEAVQASAAAASALADLSRSLPRTDGWMQTILGSKDLSDFGNKLISFGDSMTAYSLAIAGMDIEAVQASAIAGQALADLTNSLPRSDGWMQTILGSKDISSFGQKLVSFGTGLKRYSESIVGIDVEAINQSASAGKALSDLTNSLPKSDGWVQTILGSKDLDDFGEKLSNFGGSLNKYSQQVSGIDLAALSGSTTAFKSLVSMAEEIVDVNYDGLDSLGNNLKKFSNNINILDAEKMDTVGKASTNIINLSKTISGADFSGFERLGDSIKKMVDSLEALDASNLDSVGDSLMRLADSSIASFVNGVNNTSTNVYSAGQSLIKNLSNGAMSEVSALSTGVGEMLESILQRIRSKNNQFIKAGKSLITKFGSAMKSGASSVKNAVISILDSAISNMDSYHASFHKTGAYLAEGFADGISSSSYLATARATEMAKAAERAARKQLRTHSPSKVFQSIGRFVPQGFARGIDDLSWMGADSAASMAKEAIKGTGNAISRIADLVSEDINTEPTIRPVLDLSDISSNANRLNSMFDMHPSIGLMSNVSAVNSMMNSNHNRATNDDVISAIKDLGRKLGSSGDTYNFGDFTYDDNSNVSEAVKALVRAARLERRT